MVKLNELVKEQEDVFPNTPNKAMDDVKGLDLQILALCSRKGKDGSFLVIKADTSEGEISFTCGGKVIIETLTEAITGLGSEITDEVLVLKEAIECKIIGKKAESGREYFIFA